MDPETRRMIQKLLFWDYVELTVRRSKEYSQVLSVKEHFLTDFDEHQALENYEMCQLYKDTLQALETEFADIG